jgi:hypothetical protein
MGSNKSPVADSYDDWARDAWAMVSGELVFTDRDASFCWLVTDESFSLRKTNHSTRKERLALAAAI